MPRPTFLLVFALLCSTPTSAEPIPITGQVRNEIGRPFEGVEVSLHPARSDYEEAVAGLGRRPIPPARVKATTGADGRFRIEAPDMGAWRLRIEAPDRDAVHVDFLPLLEPIRLPPLPLPRPASTRVRVVTSDGRPVEGAEVSAYSALTIERGLSESTPETEIETFRGRVVDTQGLPIVDALVWYERDPHIHARTADDGTFALDLPLRVRRSASSAVDPLDLMPHREALLVAHDGYTVQRSVGFETNTLPDIVLRPEAVVVARVVDARDLPIADATVHIHYMGPKELEENRWTDPYDNLQPKTDDTGRVALRKLIPGGQYRLTVAATGFAGTQVELEAPQRSNREGRAGEVVWRLPLGRTLTGRMVNAEGTPISGVEIKVDRGGLLEPRRATTDGGGSFRFENVPRETVRITTEADGFADGYWPVAASDDPAGPSDLGDLVLHPPATVQGRVVDGEGQGLADARIFADWSSPADPDDPGSWRERQTSGADGRFTLDGVPNHGRLGLRVTGPRGEGNGFAWVDLPTRAPVEIRIEERALVKGRVFDAGGSPAARAEVVVTYLTNEGPERRETETESDGTFVFDAIDAGRVRLGAAAGASRSESRTVDLSPGETLDGIELRLAAGNASLAGVVRDGRGAPIVDAEISVSQWSPNLSLLTRGTTVTDGQGRFEIGSLYPGLVSVDVLTVDGQSLKRNLTLEAGRQGIEIDLYRSVRLAGIVLDASGSPIEGVTVRTTRWAHPDPATRTLTGTEGRFELAALPAPVSALYLDRPGSLLYEVVFDDLLDGPIKEDTLDLRLTLPSTRLEGVVHGRPSDLAKARVATYCGEFRRGSGAGRADLRLDPEGKFSIAGLTPCRLWAVHVTLGHRIESREFPVEAGDDLLRTEITLADGFEVTGLVTLDGEPLRNASILVLGDAQWSVSTRADSAGRFRLLDALAGPVKLLVGHQRLKHNRREIRLELEGNDHLVVPLTSTDE